MTEGLVDPPTGEEGVRRRSPHPKEDPGSEGEREPLGHRRQDSSYHYGNAHPTSAASFPEDSEEDLPIEPRLRPRLSAKTYQELAQDADAVESATSTPLEPSAPKRQRTKGSELKTTEGNRGAASTPVEEGKLGSSASPFSKLRTGLGKIGEEGKGIATAVGHIPQTAVAAAAATAAAIARNVAEAATIQPSAPREETVPFSLLALQPSAPK
jgi:hypothetical protein